MYVQNNSIDFDTLVSFNLYHGTEVRNHIVEVVTVFLIFITTMQRLTWNQSIPTIT